MEVGEGRKTSVTRARPNKIDGRLQANHLGPLMELASTGMNRLAVSFPATDVWSRRCLKVKKQKPSQPSEMLFPRQQSNGQTATYL